LYQTLALYDVVTVEARPASTTSIRLTSNHALVPTDSRNTAWKMTERLLSALELSAAVTIHIDKRLPVQGGLGAGSANAAAALFGLERELGVRVPSQDRLRLAAEIGSDVPLFLLGGTVIGVGRGEEVYPMPEIPSMHCVLAIPEIGVSTVQAFLDWDALGLQAAGSREANSLTAADPSDRIKRLSRSIAAALSEPHSSGVCSNRADLAENPLLALVRTGIENDFERVVFPQYPFLGEIKCALAGEPGTEDAALYAALSGSGSAVFGLYQTEAAAKMALGRLQKQGVTGWLTTTLRRKEFWQQMSIADAGAV
jgi:4-diphosphocytidyl-2-C-methyl-D-erythritol kinase